METLLSEDVDLSPRQLTRLTVLKQKRLTFNYAIAIFNNRAGALQVFAAYLHGFVYNINMFFAMQQKQNKSMLDRVL